MTFKELFSLRRLLRAAVVAALYTALTLLAYPLSFGPIQLRFSECLTILPVLLPEAFIGVTVGCLISNIFSGLWTDIVFGTLATFLAALLTWLIGYRFKRSVFWAALPPVLVNALIIPAVIFSFVVEDAAKLGVDTTVFLTYLLGVAFIAAGQALAVYGLGIPLYYGLKRLPPRIIG